VKRRTELTAPRQRRLDVTYDTEFFGRYAEGIASFLGTARYLVWQTAFIAVWLVHNSLAPERFVFDPWDRGFTLLTLMLSVQAAYAAPLILLAQNRQERRDRVQSENDREVAERTQNDTEFLAREIAGVRLALADVVTNAELSDQLDDLATAIGKLSEQVEELAARTAH